MGQAGFMGQVFMEADPCWHAEQGVKAARTPSTKTIRYMIEKNLFMIEYYDLFPEISIGPLME